ncbi:DJ-1/PfpI family protein [Roseovarius sp.]|uniref:DJ-1/PfpI family protein n=1 Tax=Roseovarius sp. TaxID=1486281 RepID=UPI003A981B5F
MSVIPDAQLGDLDLDSFDALAVPGGFEGTGFYADAYSDDFARTIRHFEAKGQPVASVCVASLALGSVGVMRGRRATTYHQVGGRRKAQLEAFGATFVVEAIVEDHGLITSTGPGTSVEVSFKLLAALTTAENAAHIRQLMRIPPASQTWRSAPQVSTAA